MIEIYNPGTRIEKCNTEPGDGHKDGDQGKILVRLGPAQGKVGYFVRWDDTPGVSTFIGAARVRLIEPKRTEPDGPPETNCAPLP